MWRCEATTSLRLSVCAAVVILQFQFLRPKARWGAPQRSNAPDIDSVRTTVLKSKGHGLPAYDQK